MPVINHNISSMITGNALNTVNSELQTSLERLSTGLRINRAADDAAGLSVSNQLTTQVNGLDQDTRNIQDGTSLLNIADGATSTITSALQRMRELAVQASSDTLTSTERTYIQTEVTQLQSECDRIVNTTQYNNQPLLSGGAPWGTVGGVLQIGPNNTANDRITYKIGNMSTASLGIAAGVMDMSTQTGATKAITQLDTALTSVNTLRSNLGAMTNRLSDALTNVQTQETNMQAAESAIADTDFATETTNYTRDQILVQSSTAMLAQANQLPNTVLQLLSK